MSDSDADIDDRVDRVMDTFSNELNEFHEDNPGMAFHFSSLFGRFAYLMFEEMENNNE